MTYIHPVEEAAASRLDLWDGLEKGYGVGRWSPTPLGSKGFPRLAIRRST